LTPVQDVLAKFRHRYLIIGSGAMRLHGIDWEDGDLDIWLDPNLSDQEWQSAVNAASGSLKQPWKRGEPDGAGGQRASTRIACSPPLDVMRDVMGCNCEDFENAYDNALISQWGSVAPLSSILHIKRSAKRLKDYRHAIKLARKLLNGW
jgi:hypothetical protein